MDFSTVPGQSFIDDFLQNAEGAYDPATGGMLAQGLFGPIVAAAAEQGVPPPTDNSPTSIAASIGGLAKGLAGVKAPAAPESNIPRLGAVSPPRPNPVDRGVDVLALIRQASGEQNAGPLSLLSRVPHG